MPSPRRYRTTLILGLAVSACAASPAGAPPASSGVGVVAAGVDEGASLVDRQLEAAWTAAGKTPAPAADDATWFRRASLDLLGRIPTEAEAKAFAADARPDRRVRAVDTLLASPEHARRLARWWEDVLLGPEVRERVVDRGAFRRWLEERFAAREGWDTIVRGLVTATGRSSAGGRPRDRLAMPEEARAAEERELEVNGAVNWILRWRKSPPDIAATASRGFLGVQIQCAQCHDHKTESWKQSDFFGFAASFAKVRVDPIARLEGFEVEEGDTVNRRLYRSELFAPMALATPHALDGTPLAGPRADAAADDDAGSRERLAAWIVSRDNPWTSRAFVNRVWARAFGMGFVDPVDDFRPSLTPVLPELLDALAERFEASGWDIRGLERSIVLSRAYGLATAPIEGDVQDARWSVFALRPLDEDALVDSLFTAIDLDGRVANLDPDRAALVRAALRQSIGGAFDADAESNATRFDGSIQQALLLMSSDAVTAGVALAPRSVLAQLLEREGGDVHRVAEALFWRTLSRPPSADERALFTSLLASAQADAAADAAMTADGGKPEARARGGRRARAEALALVRSRADTPQERALEDLFWALLNASELAFVR